MQGLRRSLFLITLPLATLGCLASIDTAKGQIIPDNTLGAEKSVVNSNANTDLIDGGARRGANLFHSFRNLMLVKKEKPIFPIRLELKTFSVGLQGKTFAIYSVNLVLQMVTPIYFL